MRTTLTALFVAIAAFSGEPTVDSLIENGHWKRARELAQVSFKAHPEDPRLNYILAKIQHAFGNLDEAAELAKAAVRLDPKMSAAHRELGEIYAQQVDHMSFVKQIGFARKIRAEFEAALAIAPKDADNLTDQIQYFMEAPGIAGGDKNKAAEMAAELVTLDPVSGYLALAYIARQQKQNDKLEGLYQKAVDCNPRNYEAQISLANYYASPERANYGQSEQHSQAALAQNPDRIAAYKLLAMALVGQKRFDDAARLIARAEAIISDDLSPYVFAARALLRDSVELPKAESYLKKYLTETREPEAGAPIIAGAHWSLGLVYEKEGRKTEARNELETALRLKPDFEPAKRDLKRLK